MRAAAAHSAGVAAAQPTNSAAGALLAGTVCSVGLAACTVAAQARRAGRVAARVASGAPTLIQILEQKKLLSQVEKLGLLSQAEKAGLGIETVEKLGLLKLAEDNKLLSLAENVLTNPGTPAQLLLGAAALGGLTYADVTLGAELGLFQWVLAGALGASALVLGGAAVVIAGITSGTRRTRNVDQVDKELAFVGKDFTVKQVKESVSLIDVIEKKGFLSFIEENRLLSLAGGLVQNPLTLTEKLKVLSTLESLGLLSQVEASATDKFGAASFGLAGLFLVTVAIAAFFLAGDLGPIAALLTALPGLALLAVGLGLSLFQAPRRWGR